VGNVGLVPVKLHGAASPLSIYQSIYGREL